MKLKKLKIESFDKNQQYFTFMCFDQNISGQSFIVEIDYVRDAEYNDGDNYRVFWLKGLITAPEISRDSDFKKLFYNLIKNET